MPSKTQPDETPTAPLIPDQRREAMLRLLRRDKVLSLHQLMESLGCSHMTVRRDIALLEREGLVHSVPGGVRVASQLATEPSHVSKALIDPTEKRAIAQIAASFLRPGMTAYLDAGTTTLALVPHILALPDITVITNDFPIMQELMNAGHVAAIHTGGLLDHANQSSVGELAAATLRQLAVDVAFISASSWDLRRGVTTPSPPKIDVKRAAMEVAEQTVLLATSAKYGTFSTYKIAGLERFDHIVSDSALPEAAASGIHAAGLSLKLASIGKKAVGS
ncbi:MULTISPECIES: DeoR/GlpR family DNA-binding transcription regulator [Paraburkholderia]|uniref:DeoR family transcriptional regulator n=2 Tax=Paraburkholderia TaxID=1822464 RepID=A0A1A5XIV0_9BURK|nr:DeoR/GlpR family DNA-binding transcription regulator [Paraburkholderia tropica]MBB2979785.1 DeoR/GlpR family transcriptional regulator of sugar metabolism [Paraburkholderia tropica]MBB3000616.1 DeoR/GlpR family transcriptional regulator of sugar metabolism [Paraburkholderia tropica]MBB6320245.1 DeoR/GlpR family transcriptional regulator of sugar metabolism [Paraburkholderia tropica]MDE1143738.1 DeoR/GlpR family DNA-binding transcription regulator [Paraburkholderia tropica]OBR53264.1 DeoR fa